MIRMIALVLLVLATTAQAQSCEPKTWRKLNAPGSATIQYFNFDGGAVCWWCPANDELTLWRAQCFAGLYKLGWEQSKTSLAEIIAAEDSWAKFQSERDRFTVVPAPGSADECAYKKLRFEACVSLKTTSLGTAYPPAVTKEVASSAGSCGPAPTCVPPTPVTTWRTPESSRSGSLTMYAVVDGKRQLPALSGRSAPFDALCDCNLFRQNIVSGTLTFTYCALAGGPANECTQCREVTK